MKKSTVLGFALLPLLGAVASQAGADTYSLESVASSLTPIYVAGHEGDPTQVEGFSYVSDVTLGGAVVGSESGTVTLDAPPLNLANPVSTGTSTSTYTITGLGSVTAHCTGGLVTTASTATSGAAAMAAWCYLDGGTGALKDVAGTLTSYGSVNMLTNQATLHETANIPDGI